MNYSMPLSNGQVVFDTRQQKFIIKGDFRTIDESIELPFDDKSAESIFLREIFVNQFQFDINKNTYEESLGENPAKDKNLEDIKNAYLLSIQQRPKNTPRNKVQKDKDFLNKFVEFDYRDCDHRIPPSPDSHIVDLGFNPRNLVSWNTQGVYLDSGKIRRKRISLFRMWKDEGYPSRDKNSSDVLLGNILSHVKNHPQKTACIVISSRKPSSKWFHFSDNIRWVPPYSQDNALFSESYLREQFTKDFFVIFDDSLIEDISGKDKEHNVFRQRRLSRIHDIIDTFSPNINFHVLMSRNFERAVPFLQKPYVSRFDIILGLQDHISAKKLGFSNPVRLKPFHALLRCEEQNINEQLLLSQML